MRLFIFLLLLWSFASEAQVCSGPGRIPQSAIGICGTLSFHQPDVPSCNAGDLAQNECVVTPATTSNSVWYKFHCYQGGTLGFLITPASSLDDYDWAVMDYTGRPPQDVLTADLVLSLNMCGFTGNTGCTAAGTSDVNCEGNTEIFNRMPLLITGHDYLLMVTNWSNSNSGYDLAFNGGIAVLTDNQPPAITSVGITGCNAALIKVLFSEDILCNSLTSTGSEFSITNGTHVITTVSSACAVGSSTFIQLSIALQAALLPGNYSLVVNNGTDLNTLSDVCGDIIPVGASFPFTVPAQVPLIINNIAYTGCAPTILKVALSKPVLCSSVTATGSEFSITPGTPAIASVQSVCSGGGYTDTLRIILQNPLLYGNYQLTVNDGTDGNTFIDTCSVPLAAGYQFPFVINQTGMAPSIQSVVFNECTPDKITVNFDKPVSCNSLSVNGSEFSVTPGTLTVSGILTNCTAANYISQVILTLSGNLPAGSFTVHVNNGTDGNTLSDSCFSFMPINTIKTFITTQAPLPVYDSLQYDKCSPFDIKIFYSKAINCASVAALGNEFYITGPSPVNIMSVNGNPATCPSGYSNWLTVHLLQPINVFGNYKLHNRWGSDGNSVIDTCSAAQDTAETISFNVLGKPSAVFADEVKWGCVEDTIALSHPGGNGINSWTWNFSDNTAATGQAVSHTFPVSTINATVQLIISNGICNDTLQRSYMLNNAFNAGFITVTDTSCINKGIEFINNSTGNNLQYEWNFGDNNTFNGQLPSAHAYTASDSFTIHLFVENDHGCRDTATKKVIITAYPAVDFTGLKMKYCTGETVTLVSALQGNISSYLWNNGAGEVFQGKDTITYSYNSGGNYMISLSATDMFCGVVVKDSPVIIYQVPVFDLGKDKTLCPGLTAKISVPNVAGYSYLWNNGSTAAEIVTTLQSSNYKLTVNNNGCQAEDEIFITMLDNCLIKVAGAFTPNADGINDKLKAINADLATQFSFRIYNRFGEILFSTANPLEGWNGRYNGVPAETGTYVWQLSYIDHVSKKHVYEKGTSILIR